MEVRISISTLQSIKGYDLLELIGEGAYGAVYRAHQVTVDREVAVKIILPEYANQPDFIRRFESEAQLVAQLEHLHIVPLYDYWRDPEGAYLVMRLMKGGSLDELLRDGNHWEPEAAARLVDQVASALDSAHQQGVVHRDLKPANILLDDGGNAYLSDFGIAKELGGESSATQTGAILGTPAYIAPEQVQCRAISPQTDIYALGVMLYEIFVGGHPFPDASTAELVVKHLQEPLPYVRESRAELPAALDGVIQRATAKDPLDRYRTVSALAEDLRRALHLDAELPKVPESELYNPYKGLRAFQEADCEDFFGREVLTGQLLAQLATPKAEGRFLAVVGPSGSGKSSVVKAGLLPALRKGALPGSDQWFIVKMHPGTQPMVELELALLSIAANPYANFGDLLSQDRYGLSKAVNSALPDEDDQLLLVIDQFEELFSLVEDETEQRRFLESLFSAVMDSGNQLRVLITLRADFYDQPLRHPEFGRLVEERTVVVLPLSPEELESVVRKPAGRVGAIFEEGLVAAIMSDVADQPGSLPLLQYALTELFERREGRMLTCQAYQSIGGVLGALGRRAEEVYASLGEERKVVARQLFLRLVTLGEGGEDTRRRVLRSELEALTPHSSHSLRSWDRPLASLGEGTGVREVLDSFGRARLLSFDHDPDTRQPTVEVAHEALLREWRRLRSWLDNSRVDVRMQRVLANMAIEWQKMDCDPGYLLRDSRLNQFEDWAAATDIALTRLEGEYLDQSLTERRARQAEEEQRLAREASMERRSRNFLRGLVGVLAVATIVALVLTIYAFNQRGEAQNSAATAQAETMARSTQQSIAETEADRRATQQAIAEAEADARATAEAIAIEERDKVLQQASRNLADQALKLKNLGDPELAVLLALAGLEEYPYTPQAEAALAEIVVEMPSTKLVPGDHNISWLAVAWSPTEDRIATATYGEFIQAAIFIQDPQTGSRLLNIPLGVDCHGPTNVIWSPSGDRLIAIPQYCDYAPRIFDGKTGGLLTSLSSGAEQANFSAAWSPDGKFILTGSLDGIARIWDASSGDKLSELPAHDNYITRVAWSRKGDLLATASNDDTAKIWEAESGELLHVLGGYQDDVSGLAWSPDSRYIAVTSLDASARVWDVVTGEMIFALEGHNDQVWDVAWSPDGRLIATDSREGKTRFWDAATGKLLFESRNNLEEQLVLNSIDWSPGGDRALIMGVKFNQIWDLSTWSPVLSGHTRGLNMGQWSPDGKLIATASLDHTARIWDSASGELLAILEHSGPVEDLSWSPDSVKLATAYQNGSIRLWKLESKAFKALPKSEKIVFKELAWSPDGRRLVASNESDLVSQIWDLNSGEIVTLEQRETRCYLSSPAWSPSGDRLITGCVSGSKDTPALIWDAETGEELARLESKNGNSQFVDWSPDGKWIAVGYSDPVIRIWDLESLQPETRFSSHTDRVVDLSFSPNSQRIVSVDAGRNVLVWDALTGEVVRDFQTLNTPNAVSWSPDGGHVMAATFGHEPEFQHAWESTTALIQFAEDCCVNRVLTPSDRQHYGLPEQ